MRSGGALPLPKHQAKISQVGPTKAKADFINSSSLGMATQNAGNILNQIMSNKKNQPFVNFIDTRTNDPVVPGKKLEATRKHDVKGVSREELMKMVNQAKKLNTDPSTAITTALWETNMGQTDPNLVHDLYQIAPTEEGLEGFDAQADMAMQAINRQLALGKRLHPNGPFYKQMQAMQGYGKIYPHTERGYYKHDNQAFFGIPVSKDKPLDTSKVFPYGKTIENFRDSVVIPTLDQYGIQYKEQGGLTRYQDNGEVEEDYTEDQKREMAQWLSGQELYDLKEKLLRENQGLIATGDYGKYGRDYYLEEDPEFKKIPRTLSDGYEYNERLELIDRMQNPAIKSINRNVNAPYVDYPDVPETLEEAARFSNYNPRLKKDSSGLFPVQPSQESELKRGGLTKAQQGQTVSQLWKEVTGTDWSKAKEMGLTDGSYEKNMEVRNALSKYMQSQPQPKKESKPAAPAYPWSPGGKYYHKDNPRLVNAKERKPDPAAISKVNALVADAMNQNNPTPVDAIPNMSMKAAQDIANLNSKVVNRDDTKLAPKGSTREKFQGALDYFNEGVNNATGMLRNLPGPLKGIGALADNISDMFISMPGQSGLNIANTVKGDRPIRNDEDIANLGWDAAMVVPYVGEGFRIGKNVAGQTLRKAIYRGVEPFDYNFKQKVTDFVPNLVKNTIDPNRQLRSITQKFKESGAHHKQAERFGKNMLDSWANGLGLPQKYGTLTKTGENAYKITNFKPSPDRFKELWKEVNRSRVKSPNQQLIVEKAKNPEFSKSIYDYDADNALMGQFRWDVKKLKDGNLHFQSYDKYDIHPFQQRGKIFANPESWVDEWRNKDFNKYFKDFEALSAVGGKPYTVQNSFIVDPKTWKVVKKWEEGGELTSEKAIEILQDGVAHGKPLTAAQKRYFTIIANKNKRNG